MTQSVTELGLPTPKERRRLREAADLTHEEIAAAVGVTSNTVRSWETGRTHPRGRKLEAYSKLLARLSADESAPAGPTARTDGSGSPAREGRPGSGSGSDPGRSRTATGAGAGAPDQGQSRGDGAAAGTGTGTRAPDREQGRGDGAAADAGAPARAGSGSGPGQGSAQGDGAPGAPGRPAWANAAATPQAGVAASARAAGADADAAPSAGATAGDRLDGAAEDAGTATGAASTAADAASAAEASEAADTADSADSADSAEGSEAAEGRFGLRMMRGLTRPVGAQTRPKAAVKRAAKPPAGMPRHEAKSPARAGAGAGAGAGHGGGAGRTTLRPGGPLPQDTGADEAAGTGSDTGTHAEPRSGKSAARATGEAATGTDPASAAGKAAGPDAASGTRPDPAAETAPAAQAGTAPQAAPGADAGEDTPRTAAAATAFDALYERTAPALARQAYLLTGRHTLSCEAVERAFQQAWDRWPEVATDPDPVGWVRAATYEYALSPWHRFRRSHRHPDEPPADPADRVLLDAMLALPPAHRRTVLLYDGVGLDLPDTAAETEASTPTAGSRLVNAHADLADQLPELDGVAPAKQSAVLRERLGALRPAGPLEPRVAAAVRVAGEHRNRLWTRAVVGVTAVIAAATAYTWVTAPTEYEPPRAPGASVSGVPPHSGPQQLTNEGRQLHDKLLSDPSAGPSRIAPSLE
ncbi:helix-turn-helix domain-containing protein [Streptomyces sp. NPDC051563]|uniref:helix-turn-helix domain-containing protein n=1 Tax=Streptomyces sp. NPDC051563 TaxID=3365659 RepID=UPI0037B46B47